jgi:hypothetical protein
MAGYMQNFSQNTDHGVGLRIFRMTEVIGNRILNKVFGLDPRELGHGNKPVGTRRGLDLLDCIRY